MARTDGTSAELTISRSLETTVIAGNQPLGVRSANFSVDFVPARSTQLSTTRLFCAVICGTELFAPAGDASASTLSAAGAWACPAAHQIAKTPNVKIQFRLVMFDPNPPPSS